MLASSVEDAEWRAQVRALLAEHTSRAVEIAAHVLDAIGFQTIAHLRSLTDVLRPPAKTGEPWRRAHPGGWADVTSMLAASYTHRVERTTDGVRLVLANTAGYAIYLEARDGYWVLSGAIERGGYVDRVLRSVIADVAPNWDVEYE